MLLNHNVITYMILYANKFVNTIFCILYTIVIMSCYTTNDHVLFGINIIK